MGIVNFRPTPRQGCFLVVVLGLVFQPILVGDLFGYLVYGEWMIENGSITALDRYSFTAQGSRWINHEWLFQGLLGGIHETVGWYGLLGLQLVLVLALLYCLAGFVDRTTRRFSSWALTLVVPVLALVPALTLRPQMVTYLAILLTVALLAQSQQLTSARGLILILVFALWANVHGGVLVGVAFLGFMLVRRSVLNPEQSVHAAVVFLLCCLATIINPYGLELWSVILGTIHDPMTAVFIEEWRPTWEFPYHMTVWSLLGIQWIVGFLRSDRGFGVDEMLRSLCLLGVAVLSLWPRRNLTYYGLAVAALAPPFRLSGIRFQGLSTIARHGLLLGGYSGGILLLLLTLSTGFESGERSYPTELLSEIPEDSTQNVFVHYPWAQWAFYHRPNVRVFLDGRWKNVYPDDVREDYAKILLGEADLLQDYGARWVLLPGRYPINDTLSRGSGWHLVAEDEDNLLWRYNKTGVRE